jgi:hypothetical protein
MTFSKPLLEYVDERLAPITDQLENLLLAMSKYATSPVCVMQFLISRINLRPSIVLMAFNDKNIISSLSKTNSFLNDAMMDSAADATSPTAIVFQNMIEEKDIIYNVGEGYYYSSAYLINIPSMRSLIKEKSVKKLALYTNNDRNNVSCNLEVSRPIEMMKLPDIVSLPIKLPFRNIIKVNPHYEGIVKSIIEENMINLSESEIEELFENTKQKQISEVKDIKILRDFLKQKPKKLCIYKSKEEVNDDIITTVALSMGFNNKFNHILFYRYIDGIVDKILGNIEEVKKENGC